MIQSDEKPIRILLIDDNEEIHKDFRSVLLPEEESDPSVAEDEAVLFGTETPITGKHYIIDSAYQGLEGIERVAEARKQQHPYALAFVDVRMPPGIDGIETIKRIWYVDPSIQIVLCTAYSDYSWTDIVKHLGANDRLLIMKKPFESIEARQIANAMSEKWKLHQELDSKIRTRTQEMNRRIHQLTGLCRISEIAHRTGNYSLDERLQAMIQIIPKAFDDADRVQAIIELGETSFASHPDNGAENVPLLSHNISIHGKPVGSITITIHNTTHRKQSIIKEEELLLKAITEQIGGLMEIEQVREALNEAVG